MDAMVFDGRGNLIYHHDSVGNVEETWIYFVYDFMQNLLFCMLEYRCVYIFIQVGTIF